MIRFKRELSPRATGGIFAFIGMLFLLIGVGIGFNTWKFLKQGKTAPGTVVDLVYSSSGKSGVYKPVVEFKDDQGKPWRVTAASGSKPAAYAKGDQVRVIFDPANPKAFYLDSFVDTWLLPLVFVAMGAIFSGIGWGILLF